MLIEWSIINQAARGNYLLLSFRNQLFLCCLNLFMSNIGQLQGIFPVLQITVAGTVVFNYNGWKWRKEKRKWRILERGRMVKVYDDLLHQQQHKRPSWKHSTYCVNTADYFLMERLHFIGKVIPLKEWINLNHVLLIPDFLLLSMMLVEDSLAVNECMCKYQV